MAKKYMPPADNAKHPSRPSQGPAKGPARKIVKRTNISPPNVGQKRIVPRAGM